MWGALWKLIEEYFATQEYTPMTKELPKIEAPKPVVHSKAWCGGSYAERMDMYYLAKTVCAQEKLSAEMTRDLLATIMGESGYNRWCVNDRNKNGTVDYGICQFNTGTNKQGVPYWIGKGAAFKDVDEVINNPTKCIKVMAKQFKLGNAKWWMAFPHRAKFFDKEPK